MSRDERILQRKLSCQIRRIDGFIESVDSIIQAGETIRLEIMGEELKEIKEKIETLYDELFSLDEVDIDKESEAYDGSMNKIGSLRPRTTRNSRNQDKKWTWKVMHLQSPTGQRFPSHHDNKRMLRKIGTCPKEIRSDDYRGWKHTSAAFFIDKLEFVMKRFWEIESVPSPDLCTQDEDCERLFSKNHGRDSHGRFRTYPVAITADIEKMYRQIRIHPEDADYQRILWRPSPEEPVVDYRLLTVTYGTTSAPFLAMRTLQQLAEDEGQNYPEASRVTLNDFYVDDLLTGAQTIAETKELIDQLKDLMKKGGFHLRKWNSNCHEIVSHVEEMNEERKINLEKGAISKILGIVWDHVQDTFRVNITLPEEVVTKRDLLSNIARIFDPLGFLSPTTVAMANLQRQTAVKEVEDLEGLPVYHRAILKENGEWPEVTKAIQCSYPKVFVGDGTHLYLLIEDVESLDGPNVRSVLYQYHIPHKKWIWRKVNGFAPIVISKSIVYASHDKRVYFVGGRIHSRGNKVTCTDNIVRVKLKEGRASVLVKSRKSPLTDLLVLETTFAPTAFLFMLAETRDHSTYKVFSYHLLNKDWHLIGSDKIFWKEKFLSLQICYTNKKLLLFPRMQWEQHFCNLYNYRLQTDSWGCYTTIPILGEKEGYPKNINHFTIVQDWVRAVFVHAGKESKYLWKLNLKSKQWTELPTYVKYRDSQYTAVALDLVFILGPADKEHETAEKYLSFFKTRRCELPKFGLLPESTYDLLRSWLRFPSNLNQGSAAGGIESRDVKFIENKKGVSLLKSDQNEVQDYCIFKFPEENFDYDSENKPSEESNIQELEEATQQQQNNVVPYLRPSARNKYYCELSSDEEELSDDSRLDPTFDPTEHNLFALDEIPIPNSYEEAINSKNPEYWIEAMQREMNSLQEHQVWDHVYLPKGVKPIKSKWVYSSKVDPSTGQTIFKARLVALGCCQKDGTYFQNICSPVMKSDSFRTLLAYCVLQGWSLIHCDVQTAFLYGKLDEDIYLLPPQGYQPTDENLVFLTLNNPKESQHNLKSFNLLSSGPVKDSRWITPTSISSALLISFTVPHNVVHQAGPQPSMPTAPNEEW
ncbi:hypothetical protein LAZ67_9001158 [Cordylochernes scorpioides]|uniref:Reverse transcriptase Ty1/copia-type domain-containing protein n=1 Tax=Cordylochernes scorpioides TaxID=51811 RepID=A0ABY6KST7_9ARAC|nr:hypothetical protein LAZ67_9001158 [Cordylochernes scorpioides]